MFSGRLWYLALSLVYTFTLIPQNVYANDLRNFPLLRIPNQVLSHGMRERLISMTKDPLLADEEGERKIWLQFTDGGFLEHGIFIEGRIWINVQLLGFLRQQTPKTSECGQMASGEFTPPPGINLSGNLRLRYKAHLVGGTLQLALDRDDSWIQFDQIPRCITNNARFQQNVMQAVEEATVHPHRGFSLKQFLCEKLTEFAAHHPFWAGMQPSAKRLVSQSLEHTAMVIGTDWTYLSYIGNASHAWVPVHQPTAGFPAGTVTYPKIIDPNQTFQIFFFCMSREGSDPMVDWEGVVSPMIPDHCRKVLAATDYAWLRVQPGESPPLDSFSLRSEGTEKLPCILKLKGSKLYFPGYLTYSDEKGYFCRSRPKNSQHDEHRLTSADYFVLHIRHTEKP